MTPSPRGTALCRALVAGLDDSTVGVGELWARSLALGADFSRSEFAAIFAEGLELTDHDYDVIAHALNEWFTELGRNHPVPYAEAVTSAAAREV